MRKGDKKVHSYYRPDRIFKDGGMWYFSTREKTIEGPFTERHEAEARLEDYIRIMTSGWLNPDSGLAVEPLENPPEEPLSLEPLQAPR